MKNIFLVKIVVLLISFLLVAANLVISQTLPPLPKNPPKGNFNLTTIKTPKGSDVEADFLKAGSQYELTNTEKNNKHEQ